MRTARRYLASEIYRSCAVVLLALLGLFTFFALIDELDKVNKNFTLLNLFYLESLQLPTRLYELLPIGLLIGAVLALASLAQRNELVILRVSGVSGLGMLGMLWVVTIPLMVGAFLLSEYITPAVQIKASEAQLQLLGRSGGGRLSSGYWFKENTADGGSRIINIRQIQASGQVSDITVLEMLPEQALDTLTQAPSGQFHSNGLRLDNATIITIDPTASQALHAETAPEKPLSTMSTEPTLEVRTALTADRLIARILTPEMMSASDLIEYIAYLKANELQTDRQMVALWRKIAYPFTLLVMMTIAAPVSFMQTRRGGVGTKVFAGILIGVGFFMANQMALNIGTLSKWAPWVTALGPNIIALAIALIALLIMENRNRFTRRRTLLATAD
ncbi:LPS export ABC transporter permease LptG [Paenalcaligenes suwonensis]|uniref:LPS export ABC transporter permease LptG n=1 Tax=Paenalcaligenes suwonensis TaxID=1202713 RepID=UPI00140B94D2|nr:LPS export ABC transporter permease LptG [Paenalcaligenes suwonensis]NHC60417.1 LPS export ABC transporter permease LptG [Paenalcaligenes suwonensis]